MADLNLGTKEVKDLTRIERIGAHSHIRGTCLCDSTLRNFYCIHEQSVPEHERPIYVCAPLSQPLC